MTCRRNPAKTRAVLCAAIRGTILRERPEGSDDGLGTLGDSGTPVLSCQDGDWRTAILDDGIWRGRLEEIVGGYGYWMFSIAPETIAVDIPEQERRETLPSVPVTHGWNLLGVIDFFRKEQAEPPGPADGGGGEADHYFATIPWRMAYTFDTPRNRWVRLIPRDDESGTPDDGEPPGIVNGRGYWVWSVEPSTLVP